MRLLLLLSALLFTGSAMASDALFRAAVGNDVATIEAELANGAELEARDGQGRTALLLATRAAATEAARVLIAAGADANAKDDISDTPYLYAGAEGRTEILRLLLAAGADLGDTNRFGGTALIPAAEKGHLDNVRILLDAGVNPNHVNRLGWTALLEAIILTDGGPVHRQIVAALIAGGADVNLPDGEGVTPLQHAEQRGFPEIAALLRAAGAR